jgi:hypothetical protein
MPFSYHIVGATRLALQTNAALLYQLLPAFLPSPLPSPLPLPLPSPLPFYNYCLLPSAANYFFLCLRLLPFHYSS